ncbi:response regulator receiver domain-containing protein [Lutibacter sp. Hel_I_33_5]|nr:response regulator [Lutibacter sp. Hel_I_33_5]TVZ55584.1 response regulator receiver domain-containing protein [Lutibacter sp. Hel_I_33_5]
MVSYNILLIEDDEIERIKFRRVCQKNGASHKIVEASNGEKALELLQNKDELPNIILLDLNMPKMNGLEFLKTLKKDDALKYVPIFVLSTSNNYKDIKDCYSLGVCGYLIKPLHFEVYKEKIACFLNYLTCNEFVFD